MLSRVKLKFTASGKQPEKSPVYPVYKEDGGRELIFPLQDCSANAFVIFNDGSFGIHESCEFDLGPEVKLNIEAEEV